MYRTVYIHIFNLQDGSPYGTPPSNKIAYEIPSGDHLTVYELTVTRSRVMMRTYIRHKYKPGRPTWGMIVWDVKTGDLVSTLWFGSGHPSLTPPPRVLNISTDDGSTSIRGDYHAAFLDEFQILVSCHDNATGTPELVVFDTCVLQDHPEYFRRFGLPPRYRYHSARINVGCDRPLGSVASGEPLIVDPFQAVLVVELNYSTIPDTHVLLVVRTNALTERRFSVRTDPFIPWEEWGQGSVTMKIPLEGITLSTFVYGTRVVVVLCVSHNVPDRLYTFDSSKLGYRALPPWGGVSGVGMKSTFEDGQGLVLEGSQGMDPRDMLLLGNGILVYLDSVSYHSCSGETMP